MAVPTTVFDRVVPSDMNKPRNHDGDELSPELAASLERIREDIQRAVASYEHAISAVNPIGVSLASAINDFHDQWSSLTAAVKPVADAWKINAAEIKTALEGANSLFSEMAQDWAAAQLSLQNAMEEAAPRIRETLEGAATLGAAGWTLPMSFTVFEMQWIAKLSPTDLDAHFIKYYEARDDAELNNLERQLGAIKALEEFRPLLAQCFNAYRRGEFAITIAPLVSLFERTIRNLCPPKHFYGAKFKESVEEQYCTVKQNAPDTMEAYLWMSLFSFVRWLYHYYGPGQANLTRPFRHGIQHGTQAPPNDRVETLRLLHALSTAAALYEA